MTATDDHHDSGPERDDNKQARMLREAGPFLSLGLQLAGTVLALFLIGYWIDGEFGTYPFGQVIGGLVGCIGGLINFAREASRMGGRQRDGSNQH